MASRWLCLQGHPLSFFFIIPQNKVLTLDPQTLGRSRIEFRESLELDGKC